MSVQTDKCPTCGSPSPERHPAMQCEGEVELCTDAFHLQPTNMNKPEYIAAVRAKIAHGDTGCAVDALLGNLQQPGRDLNVC